MSDSVSVFLFTGFLGAGKTTFIQQSLEHIGFCTGEPTLLLVCEEGEEEYEPARFANTGVMIRTLSGPEELTAVRLTELRKEAQASRVLIEYNGMWTSEALEAAMPDNWHIFREMAFFEAASFPLYNHNLRTLVYDKLKKCDVAAFTSPDGTEDRLQIHRIVRGISRRAGIAYQYRDGHTEYDAVVDTDPFDLNAEVVCVGDGDYAYWSRDITEAPRKYDNKCVQLKCRTVLRGDLPEGTIGVGRYVMVCCENDIQFVGFLCEGLSFPVENNTWILLTGTIHLKFHAAYGRVGPVFSCAAMEPCEPPQQTVATF